MRDDPCRLGPGHGVTLVREHALARLAEDASERLALLVAPAGYGKTTVLAQYADRFPGQVVRWRPCRGTTEPESLLAAIARQLPSVTRKLSVETCVLAVERRPGPVLLLVDDLHLIHGTAAEHALEEIALLAPPNLRVVAAGRRLPLLNLTRRELLGTTVLRAADLRFRTDETREFLGNAPQGPDDLAALTLGWPAVLHLLRPVLVHRLDATALGLLTRGYLDREVLGALPDRLLGFLEQVSALPVLDPERCDALLGSPDSTWLLDELANDRGLLEPGRDAGTFHWVPLLREHLARRPASRGTAEPRPVGRATAPAEPAVAVRCFGGFDLTLGDRPLDWSLVRPRARALLRMLAIHPGRPVHRELLMEALWPHRPPATAARALHVAVSTLRTFLEPGVGRGAAQLLVRSGEAYVLRIPAQASCDLRRFETAVAEGLRAIAAGRPRVAAQALRLALDTYTGDLLPEDGPAEWVVDRREHYRRTAAEAALALAKLELAGGRPPAAAQAAGRSLDIDPFRDDAWQTLIAAQQRCGDTAAAERSRKGHARMLLSLGLPSVSPGAGEPGLGDLTVA
ncbi:hypothetical protein GCM10010193_45030 [Kitasatospora atroaurantiaca]|uniref:AAA domain-containing protein n=1 Tax=Kitasatospora atroaurantiaca TaxID=285545 RepID=A0A561EZS7_9ACTN|nr:BTAD domain-containing putative transcriptional regulator [Kitasatospora atroaurantiaca]TWE21115.1 AAA domain-containing protein [Kitasatospora atroaurantiaca]